MAVVNQHGSYRSVAPYSHGFVSLFNFYDFYVVVVDLHSSFAGVEVGRWGMLT